MSGETAVTETAEPKKMNHYTDKNNSKDGKETDIEFQILAAMRSRATYLRDQAESIALESVRRLLEEDMGLEKKALDVHKSFVKENLVKCLEDTSNDGSSETEKKDDVTPAKEVAKLSEEHEAKDEVRVETANDEKIEMNILAEKNTSKTVAEDTKDEVKSKALMSDIKRALQKRSSYIKANSEKITVASLRRLLEQDLKLEKHSLDPFKKFINEELDAVLQSPDAPKSSTKSIGKNTKKQVKITKSKKVASEEISDSNAEGDVDDEEVAVKKTRGRKRKSEMTGKLVSGKKKAKRTETDSENGSDAEDSEMKAEKPMKKTKETTTTVYGKRVEHLKSVIKSCGMSIPPSVYRKAKQAPEERREATLIDELEQILAKEGLSSSPSEKEIKEVRKKKDRTKELEGIDTSNIVSSTRRRSTISFAPPPKPKLTEESESESDDEPEPEDSENEEEEEEKEEEGNEEADDGSQSEAEDEESNNEDDDDDGGDESD